MRFLYTLSIFFYHGLIKFAAFFHPKAKLWVKGRKNLFAKMAEQIDNSNKICWIHTASLGEFEQGRPLIERIKKEHPEFKILLTFFSPSGYEVKKNSRVADYIFYLPVDTPRRVERFLNIVQPEMAIFVKYEFWYHFLHRLAKRNIPVYSISAIFRKEQAFFKWYGKWYKKMLLFFTHIFVQNQQSKLLLQQAGIQNVSISGDTRFDRVYEIARKAKSFPEIDQFCMNKPVFIAGSSWQADENLLVRYINHSKQKLKYIIAPHEIHKENIKRLENGIKKSVIRFSRAKSENVNNKQVMIIDNIGMLSSLYTYGDVAYIGGGFGVGIHNILEAATFGLPVIFGPNYQKFQEAIELIAEKGAFSIENYQQLTGLLDKFFSDTDFLTKSGEIARNYVEKNRGGTQKIISKLF